MKIPYRDLSVKDRHLKQELLQAIEKVLSHGRIILGPEVERFERLVADYCGTRFAAGVSSGTDALYLALMSLDVGPGDEVITTPLSWVASTSAIALTGALPVFADIREDLNIDPVRIAEAITPRTRAILPVHFTGRLCDMDSIMRIAHEHELMVVEDSAQAFGAHRDDARAGSFGTAGCFSMNPMKVFCAYGEAGAVVTDDEQVYKRLGSLRYAGTVNKEDCHVPSLNGRIDTIHAATLLVEFPYLQEKIESRRRIACFYTQRLNDVVVCPEDDSSYHIYYSYTVLADRRDELIDFLLSRGVETKIQHPILIPDQMAYRGLPRPDIRVSRRLIGKILCLPNQDNLTEDELEYVVKCVREFYGVPC